MTYRSGKIYGHNIGLSCCFRQWRAHSHCNQLHGYALQFEFDFEADELDAGWVVDFGGLKTLRGILEDNFDHKLLVAEDDPLRTQLEALERAGLASVVVVPAVGCEAFAQMAYEVAGIWLKDAGYTYRNRVRVHKVTVREHGANWASYMGHKV